MRLKSLEINGFKSFAKKSILNFNSPITSIVGPNGSGKSNVAESFRFVLGEQSFKSMRGKRGEDLIFGGTNDVSKSNRASVKVIFDNVDKTLPVDFEEVILERVVHRDGVNEYLINGSQVRLRDIIELLASANIGSSGHHIISQGEADKILNSSIKDRREIIEEALGLRIFQYKKSESEKKLAKTEENINQVQSLKREITPHLKFLKKQVEKLEEAKQMREELKEMYQKYLKLESVYLEKQRNVINSKASSSQKALEEINLQIQKSEQESRNIENDSLLNSIREQERLLSVILSQKNELIRSIGNVEGEINSLVKLLQKSEEQNDFKSVILEEEDLETFKKEIHLLENALEDFSLLKEIAIRIISYFKKVSQSNSQKNEQKLFYSQEIQSNKDKLALLEKDLKIKEEEERKSKEILNNFRIQLEQDKSISFEAKKKIIDLMSEKSKYQEIVSHYAIAIDNLKRDEELFKQELVESTVLVDRSVLDYDSVKVPEDFSTEDRQIQLTRRKDLERQKIKVEQSISGNGEDILKEFEEVTEREIFLSKELEDLEKSANSLKELIVDLGNQIEIKFKEGLEKINLEFQKFFALMFGGGNASLRLAKIPSRRKKDSDILMNDDLNSFEEDTDEEEGVEIHVNLPRKKIKDLLMLSGGERALTSIALLFAISQVNPPPFIILDETDAALDEANSRKYGDMIENLSKYSQLILITHNRETMSRAGILYGVTMMQGASQLLSVAFEEGLKYAK